MIYKRFKVILKLSFRKPLKFFSLILYRFGFLFQAFNYNIYYLYCHKYCRDLYNNLFPHLYTHTHTHNFHHIH